MAIASESRILKQLQESDLINIDFLKGKKESYIIKEINHPTSSSSKILLIAGSDKRGCAYGLLHITEKLGVHPLYWWSNIPVKHNPTPIFTDEVYQGSPSVEFRGIFLNDEDFGLKPWAAAKMDRDIKDIGPKTYEMIFQMLLRLKANLIWPAMHRCTKAFYHYPENPKMAEKYGIVVGSSHCEQMLCNNVDEWSFAKNGLWNYKTNRKGVLEYWDQHVSESQDYDNFYTMGMRAIHDKGMPGGGTIAEKAIRLSTIIKDQRNMLDKYFENTSEVPQVFCPYKEVLELYREGIELPEDITLLWVDDNYGYIRQLSSREEQMRSGGSGVYYHLSYMGRPNDYLWLCSASPALIHSEMKKAYDAHADKIWVFNVGDIKPAEFEIQFALDLAYNVNDPKLADAETYTKKWAETVFGREYASEITNIKRDYYRLTSAGRAEHTNYLRFSYNEEQNDAKKRAMEFTQIFQQSKAIFEKIPEADKDAYFQLIHYPVAGAHLLNWQFYLAQKAAVEKKSYTGEILNAYKEIRILTKYYNNCAEGKWKKMMTSTVHGHDVCSRVFKGPQSFSKIDNSTYWNDTAIYNQKKKLRYTVNTSDPGKIIQIEQRINEKIPEGYLLKEYKWLGTEGKSLTIVPKKEFTEIKTDPAEFTFQIPKPYKGKIRIAIKTLPTFSISSDFDQRLSLSLNNGEEIIKDIERKSKSPDWYHRVIQGYGNSNFILILPKASDIEGLSNTFTIRFYSPGIVMDSIRIFQLQP